MISLYLCKKKRKKTGDGMMRGNPPRFFPIIP